MESDKVGWKWQLKTKTEAPCVLDFTEFKVSTFVLMVYFRGC
jgi:hypothetical protein